jgi:hypothetical protein
MAGNRKTLRGMNVVLRAFGAVQALMAVLFAAGGAVLLLVAARTGWEAVGEGLTADSAQVVIEAIGLLAAAVVAFQIAQTIAEEEVIRDAHVSAPTRVRRFLSRFLVVIVVALAVEGVVATFKAVHEGLEKLVYAGALLAAVALLLAAWGWFIQANRTAEDLEPEAMQEAKDEDRKLGQGGGSDR